MAQNESSEGILGAVKSFIPGMSPSHGDAHQTNSGSQGGILSYIPGFGGGSTDNNTTHEAKEHTSKSASETGEVSSAHKSTTEGGGVSERSDSKRSESKNSESTDKFDSSYQGAGIGHKYSSRKEPSSTQGSKEANEPHTSHKDTTGAGSGSKFGSGFGSGTGQRAGNDNSSPGSRHTTDGKTGTGNNDSLAKSQNQGHGQDQGSKGNTGQQQQQQQQQQKTNDDGVRGAPIEGEDVKGYAVSAPVGSGDTNVINPNGDPSGQVSGAHMQYSPEDTDTRDHTGRGTVGRTKGEGDSSFANVKRNIPWGTEHVVTKSSQSHIEHTSTTQL